MPPPTVTRTLGLLILPPTLNYNENSQLKATTAEPTRPGQRSSIYNSAQQGHFYVSNSSPIGRVSFGTSDGQPLSPSAKATLVQVSSVWRYKYLLPIFFPKINLKLW